MKTICQGMNAGIKECPSCGKDDRVVVLDKKIFEAVMGKHGDAMVDITCRDCGLTLTDYTLNTTIRNYEKAVIHVVQR